MSSCVYPVEIRELNGLFYIICKTFNIIESDQSLENAYAKLSKKRNYTIEQLSSFGVDVRSQATKNRELPILQKWVQISVIFLCLSLPLGIFLGASLFAVKVSNMLHSAKNSVKHQIVNLGSNPGDLSYLIKNIAEKLDNVSIERKEEMQIALHKIVVFMKPYISEIQTLSKKND